MDLRQQQIQNDAKNNSIIGKTFGNIPCASSCRNPPQNWNALQAVVAQSPRHPV